VTDLSNPLTLAAWSRIAWLRQYALGRLQPPAAPFAGSSGALRILFGGDVMLDPVIRRPGHLRTLGFRRIDNAAPKGRASARIGRRVWLRLLKAILSSEYYSPLMLGGFTEFAASEAGLEARLSGRLDALGRQTWLDWDTIASDFDHPFRKLRPLFETQDLVVLNLESPLTLHARINGMFKGDPRYALAMRTAGVSVVNLSNNHAFDAGESGFMDTLGVLKAAGIHCIGVGENLQDARAGTLLDVRGTRILFLCYTQYCNAHFASLADSCPGILPLARQLMVEDVQAGAAKSDIVIVCVHWGHEHQPNAHPRQVEIAHDLIDAGAGAIIGHHPHVPQAIEVYRQRPIVYSLGNLIFAQNHPLWGDNFLAELVIDQRQVRGVIVHPVAGRGASMFQPELLRGADARSLLRRVQLLSVPFRTRIAVSGDTGYIGVNAPS
jgi:poly-gamma-glutamate synthesis protein (capsule biosynthesis protein)